MPLDPARTVAELRELRELTGDENGAQRVAWTPTWAEAKDWLGSKLDGLPLEYEVDAAGNQWWTLRGDSDRAVLMGGHIDSVPNGGWLDGCLNVVAGGRGAAPDRRRGHAAGHRPARQLGRRGRSALRTVALRLLGRRGLDVRPGRAAPADRSRRDRPPGRPAGARRRSRPRARRTLAAGERGRLPGAAHRAGAGARVDGSAAGSGARHVRRRAPPDHLARPGGPRRLDADGPAARRARRRREARARAARDRRADGRRRRAHERRCRLQAGDRHLGRRDRGAAARHAPPRRGQARLDVGAGARGLRALRAGGEASRSSSSGSGRSSRSSSTRRWSASPTRRSARSPARRTSSRAARSTTPPRSPAPACRP